MIKRYIRTPQPPAKSTRVIRRAPAASQASATHASTRARRAVASCVALRCITPSRIGGQVKRPWCSHFVTSTMPLPSHARSFTLSMRLLRNTKTSPQYGFARSASLTSADSVCTDLRKSTGCVASTTLGSDRSAITGYPGAPTAPSKASPTPRLARRGCALHSPRSRSPRRAWPAARRSPKASFVPAKYARTRQLSRHRFRRQFGSARSSAPCRPPPPQPGGATP
ncbi:hypothetical protein ACVWWR_004494 [Bradyrhizobium sp. LM3.2]